MVKLYFCYVEAQPFGDENGNYYNTGWRVIASVGYPLNSELLLPIENDIDKLAK